MTIRILTKRLKLQRLKLDDVDAMYEYRSNPIISRYQGWEPLSKKDVREFIEKQDKIQLDSPGKWLQLGVYTYSTNGLIGDCGLHFPGSKPEQVEIGITIAPEFQGNAVDLRRKIINCELLITNY